MTKYLISFASGTMTVPEGEWDLVVEESHQVIRDAKAAGVYVFGGGIDESVEPQLVHADGAVEAVVRNLAGGYTILELPTPEAALEWAQRLARACRAPQELHAFGFDPES